ncbi:MAG: fimbrillin family protein [Tannerellaceae bacterium]|jgi:endonuclease G|nr:fimbrillin family protein [Tannerellaceae bacterium]
MKTKRLIYPCTLFSLMLVTILIACHIEEINDCLPSPENERIPVVFAPKLEIEPQTKVGGNNGSSWTKGDPVGVYMTKHGSTLDATTILGQADNVLYKADKDGSSVTLLPDGDTIYYPVSEKVDFVLYYPYQAGISDFKYAVDLKDQTNQANLDLVYAHETKGFSRSDKALVPVTFYHQLAKIEFFVGKGTGITSLANLKISIRNMAAKTSFNLSTGKLLDTGVGGSDTIETYVTTHQTDSMKAEAIVLPIADLSATPVMLHFQVDTLTYEAPLPFESTQIALTAGMRYRYVVALSEIGVGLTGTLHPWEDERGGTIHPTPP